MKIQRCAEKHRREKFITECINTGRTCGIHWTKKDGSETNGSFTKIKYTAKGTGCVDNVYMNLWDTNRKDFRTGKKGRWCKVNAAKVTRVNFDKKTYNFK